MRSLRRCRHHAQGSSRVAGSVSGSWFGREPPVRQDMDGVKLHSMILRHKIDADLACGSERTCVVYRNRATHTGALPASICVSANRMTIASLLSADGISMWSTQDGRYSRGKGACCDLNFFKTWRGRCGLRPGRQQRQARQETEEYEDVNTRQSTPMHCSSAPEVLPSVVPKHAPNVTGCVSCRQQQSLTKNCANALRIGWR